MYYKRCNQGFRKESLDLHRCVCFNRERRKRMFTTLFCTFVFNDLSLDGLTLSTLFQWYMSHPFWFILAISEVLRLSWCVTSSRS